MAKKLGEPAHLVFMLHTTGAQRALVERREAERIGATFHDKTRADRQRVQHDAAVFLADDAALERGRVKARPLMDRHVRRTDKAGAVADEHNVGPGAGGRIIQELGDKLGPDAGGVAGE